MRVRYSMLAGKGFGGRPFVLKAGEGVGHSFAPASHPTSHPPGSPEKLAVLIRRVERMEETHHPDDAPLG